VDFIVYPVDRGGLEQTAAEVDQIVAAGVNRRGECLLEGSFKSWLHVSFPPVQNATIKSFKPRMT
jgi:hypothetical protein